MRSRTGLIALVTFVFATGVGCGPGAAGGSDSSAALPEVKHHAMRLAAATGAPLPQ